jgi:hypothetical protein
MIKANLNSILSNTFLVALTLIFSLSCSSLENLDRVAEVNSVNVELSPRGKVINEGRNLILEGKQSLKIALLKMKFLVPEKDYNFNSVVVLDSAVFLTQDIALPALERKELQQSLLPELYQIFSTIDDLKLKLIVVCHSQQQCMSGYFDSWIPPQVKFESVHAHSLGKLKRYRPLLILSNSAALVGKMEKVWHHDEASQIASYWIKLPQWEKVDLTLNEWNSLVPTVESF